MNIVRTFSGARNSGACESVVAAGPGQAWSPDRVGLLSISDSPSFSFACYAIAF
jgi:hypothetical protein